MDNQVYRFKCGEFICRVISDGTMTYVPPVFPPPAGFLCTNAPEERLGAALSKQGLTLENWTEWKRPYNCLLIETGRKRVLVDTGADGLGPETGKLLSNLQKEGVAPQDIDLVILTHGHPDHLGGNTDREGRLLFPGARWVIGRKEWEFWTSGRAERQLPEHGREMLIDIARKNLLPLADKIDLIDQEAEIISGIKAISAPGHTPGHIALDISSQGQHLFCLSDIVLHPLHLAEPEWCAATDVSPNELAVTRQKTLSAAAAGQALVMAFHFPFPGLGYIRAEGKAWRWEPLSV